MAKALTAERPPTSHATRAKSTLQQHLSPGELRAYIHFIRGSLHENPDGKAVLDALVKERKAERKHHSR